MSMTSTRCAHCQCRLDHPAKFCGECGAPQDKARQAQLQGFLQSFQHTQPQMFHAPQHAQARTAPVHAGVHNQHVRSTAATPAFAKVQPKTKRPIPKELQEELTQLLCLVARERLFLYMHCLIFLSMNLFGFWLSMRAYNGYIGDEITKGIIALTPLMFINTVALACLAPIKGTKREIARLKEKLSYVRFQIEYHNLF